MAIKYVLNPFSGTFDAIDTVNQFVDTFTLTSTDITNKYVILSFKPSDATKVILNIVSGVMQAYAVDFTITVDDGGKRLSWNGLGLDGLLAANDKLAVIYKN